MSRIPGLGAFPSFRSFRRRGGCGINKKLAKPTEAPQTGWSLTHHVSSTHSETFRVSDHPARAISERNFFSMARPPLLKRRGVSIVIR